MLVGKGAVRELCHEIDGFIKEIDQITQAKIDRVSDRIDAELESCGRELTSAQETLEQIQPLVDRLVKTVGANAPEAIQVLVGSIATEIMSKVGSATRNITGVQKNIKDVDEYTDQIDKLTDDIDDITDKIDKTTDKYQK